LSEMLQCCCTF